MTVYELRNSLNKLMEILPNSTNDEIQYLDDLELKSIDEITIEYDIESIGRYIVLK